MYVSLRKWALKSAAHICGTGELSVENRDAYMWHWTMMSKCEFYDTHYVKKNDNNFHISPPISTYYTSNYLSLHRLSMFVQYYHFKGEIGPSNKSTRLFSKTFFRDIISKPISTCKKNVKNTKFGGTLLITREKMIKTTLIISIKAAWMTMIALEIYKYTFKHQSQITKKWIIP